MPIGYLKKINLLESNRRAKDIAALDNLGGAGIHEDILLFSNNLNNTTTLFSREYTFNDLGEITIQTVNKIAFSNGTEVTHNGEPCIVEKSDTTSKFILRSLTTNLIVTELGSDIIRSNAVTGLNMQFINLPTESTKNVLPSIPPDDADEFTYEKLDPYTFSGIEDLDDFATYADTSTKEYLDDLNLSMESTARFFKDYKLSTEDVTFRNRLVLDGTIRLRNDLNERVFDPESPGLYIQDEAGNVKKAFSSNIDPWLLEDGGITQTQSTETYTKSLIATNLTLQGLETSTVPSNEEYTHRLEIEVDGELVNILLKETTTVD